jgi:hypothetical protein
MYSQDTFLESLNIRHCLSKTESYQVREVTDERTASVAKKELHKENQETIREIQIRQITENDQLTLEILGNRFDIGHFEIKKVLNLAVYIISMHLLKQHLYKQTMDRSVN